MNKSSVRQAAENAYKLSVVTLQDQSHRNPYEVDTQEYLEFDRYYHSLKMDEQLGVNHA